MKDEPEIIKVLRRQEWLKKKEGKLQEALSSTEISEPVSNKTMEIIEDDTDQKMIRGVLQDSKKTLRTLISLIPDPIVIVNKKGKFLEVSDRIEDITGVKREELLGKNFLKTKFITAKSKAILIKNLAKRLLGEKIESYEIEVISKDSKKLPFRVNGIRIDYDGKPADLVVFHDLSEQKDAVKELEYHKKYFEVLFDNIPYGIVTIDLDHKVKDINPGFTRIFGYAAEEIKGKSLHDFIVPMGEIPEAEQHREKNISAIETLHKRKDESLIPVEIISAPILVGDKKIGEYTIYKDITERKNVEEELKEELEELEKYKNITVGRELRIIELKKKVEELEEKLKEERKKYGKI